MESSTKKTPSNLDTSNPSATTGNWSHQDHISVPQEYTSPSLRFVPQTTAFDRVPAPDPNWFQDQNLQDPSISSATDTGYVTQTQIPFAPALVDSSPLADPHAPPFFYLPGSTPQTPITHMEPAVGPQPYLQEPERITVGPLNVAQVSPDAQLRENQEFLPKSNPRKREGSSQSVDVEDNTGRRRKRRRARLSSSHVMALPDEALCVINPWIDKYCRPPHIRIPTTEDIQSFAQLTQLRPQDIQDWIWEELSLEQNSKPFQRRSNEISQANSRYHYRGTGQQIYSTEEKSPSPSKIDLVKNFVENARKKCQTKSKPDRRQGVNQGQYYCTSRCGYRTHLQHDWKRHEENRQPQQFWVCSHCLSAKAAAPFVAHRKDKMVDHAKKMHPDADREDLLRSSKVDYEAGFKRQCGFCESKFQTWKERCDHILLHFQKDQYNMDNWVDHPAAEEEDDLAEEDTNPEYDGPYIGGSRFPFDDDAPSSGGAGSTYGGGNENYGSGSHPGSGHTQGRTNNDKSMHQGRAFGYEYRSHNNWPVSQERDGSVSRSSLSPSGQASRGDRFLLHFPRAELESRMSRTTTMLGKSYSSQIEVVPSSTFQRVKNLGHGAYASVDKVVQSVTGAVFARKTFLLTKHGGHLYERFEREINIMRKMSHPHIIKFIAAHSEGSTLNILMTPVAELNLKNYLDRPQHWPEHKHRIVTWLGCLASALSYVHSRRIRHADIKPQNILIHNSDVLISDFGISRSWSDTDSTSFSDSPMTPMYAAPEIAERRPHGRKADVFSLGCVYIELMTVLLDRSLSDLQSYLRGNSGHPNHLTYHGSLSWVYMWILFLETSLTATFGLMLTVCRPMMDYNPSRRPSALDVTAAFELNTSVALSKLAAFHLKGFGKQSEKTEAKGQVIQVEQHCIGWLRSIPAGEHLTATRTELGHFENSSTSTRTIMSRQRSFTGISTPSSLHLLLSRDIISGKGRPFQDETVLDAFKIREYPDDRVANWSLESLGKSKDTFKIKSMEDRYLKTAICVTHGGVKCVSLFSNSRSMRTKLIDVTGCGNLAVTKADVRQDVKLNSENDPGDLFTRIVHNLGRSKTIWAGRCMSADLDTGAPASRCDHNEINKRCHFEALKESSVKQNTCMKTGFKALMRAPAVDLTNNALERTMSIRSNKPLPHPEDFDATQFDPESRFDVDILEAGNHLSSSIATSISSDFDKCESILPDLRPREQECGLEDAVLELVVRQNAHRGQDHPGERFLRESCSTTYDRIQISQTFTIECDDTWWMPCQHAANLSSV